MLSFVACTALTSLAYILHRLCSNMCGLSAQTLSPACIACIISCSSIDAGSDGPAHTLLCLRALPRLDSVFYLTLIMLDYKYQFSLLSIHVITHAHTAQAPTLRVCGPSTTAPSAAPWHMGGMMALWRWPWRSTALMCGHGGPMYPSVG